MRVFQGIDSFDWNEKTVVTVGSFDGVHSGHTSLLNTLTQSAKRLGAKSVVVSFSPHPRVALGRAEGLKLLTDDFEKASLLKDVGVDALLLLEFNAQFSALSYEEFLYEYLIKRVNMVELVVGFNHHIGRNGGSYENITQLETKYNFKTTLAKEYSCGEHHISSTAIRKLLEQGEIESANILLSHNYPIFGYATENGEVRIDEPLKLIPPNGEYNAIVNGVETTVEVDNRQKVLTNQQNRSIEIQLLSSCKKQIKR